MIGQAPSCTMRFDSSWLNPRWMKARVKLPDCETPRIAENLIAPVTGFIELVSLWKNEFRSRKAAMPTPST